MTSKNGATNATNAFGGIPPDDGDETGGTMAGRPAPSTTSRCAKLSSGGPRKASVTPTSRLDWGRAQVPSRDIVIWRYVGRSNERRHWKRTVHFRTPTLLLIHRPQPIEDEAVDPETSS